MRRRVSAARNAVARSLAARTAATNATTGATGADANALVDAPQPPRGASSANIFFTSPGAAYTAVRAQQYEARIAQQGMAVDDEQQQGGDREDGAFAGLE